MSEVYRQPDVQLGFICCDVITMGQLLSFGIVIFAIGWYRILSKKKVSN